MFLISWLNLKEFSRVTFKHLLQASRVDFTGQFLALIINLDENSFYSRFCCKCTSAPIQRGHTSNIIPLHQKHPHSGIHLSADDCRKTGTQHQSEYFQFPLFRKYPYSRHSRPTWPPHFPGRSFQNYHAFPRFLRENLYKIPLTQSFCDCVLCSTSALISTLILKKAKTDLRWFWNDHEAWRTSSNRFRKICVTFA